MSLLVLAWTTACACGAGRSPPASSTETPATQPAVDTAAPPPAPAAARFELAVPFWVNLHQRLFAETTPGRAAATPQAGADTFTPAERATWDAALELYRRRWPTREMLTLLDDPLVELEARLSRAAGAPALRDAGVDGELTAALEAAAVVYRAHGWPADESADRAWIAAIEPRLAELGEPVAQDLVALFAAPWPSPIHVDVAAYAGPVGAYTVSEPALVTISSGPRITGDAAFEMLFHEASHVLVGPVARSIERACAEQGKPVPPTLWHALLFYTSGEVVRRRLPAGYVPYAEARGLYERGPDWARYRELLRAHWQPYVDGATTMDGAIDALVGAL